MKFKSPLPYERCLLKMIPFPSQPLLFPEQIFINVSDKKKILTFKLINLLVADILRKVPLLKIQVTSLQCVMFLAWGWGNTSALHWCGSGSRTESLVERHSGGEGCTVTACDVAVGDFMQYLLLCLQFLLFASLSRKWSLHLKFSCQFEFLCNFFV